MAVYRSLIAVETLHAKCVICSTILIGRAKASPLSRSAGAPSIYNLLGERERPHLVVLLERISLYMLSGDEAFLVPTGPRATRKRKAGLITSGYYWSCYEAGLGLD